MVNDRAESSTCIIFDLDGTLVDSEGLCNQAFLDLLPELDDSVDTLMQRYRGKKLAIIFTDLESRLGRKLPDNFESQYRKQVADMFSRELKATPGTQAMLKSLPYASCIASSGPLPKIRQALTVSGLATYFEDRLFSSYDINSWKPEPGLFLHAARKMGFQANQCVVIEDSQVGVEAALAAGMQVLLYAPGNHEKAQVACQSFDDMEKLPVILAQMLSNSIN